jgi:hypothetical protein
VPEERRGPEGKLTREQVAEVARRDPQGCDDALILTEVSRIVAFSKVSAKNVLSLRLHHVYPGMRRRSLY